MEEEEVCGVQRWARNNRRHVTYSTAEIRKCWQRWNWCITRPCFCITSRKYFFSEWLSVQFWIPLKRDWPETKFKWKKFAPAKTECSGGINNFYFYSAASLVYSTSEKLILVFLLPKIFFKSAHDGFLVLLKMKCSSQSCIKVLPS